MGFRACLESVKKRKILSCRESNPSHPAHKPSLYVILIPSAIKYILIYVK
jgi:hypothetical protein